MAHTAGSRGTRATRCTSCSPSRYHRRLLIDWEAVARASLAMFRADCARYAGDPDFERLVARLTRLSPEFAQWWPEREVARPLAGQKRIDHPIAGQMLFEYSSLGVGDPPDMKLIVFTPLEEEGTAQKLARLLRKPPILRDTPSSRSRAKGRMSP
jgi:MmyB-like transcription regulator ligand binding domain